jgi:hypothetical protein
MNDEIAGDEVVWGTAALDAQREEARRHQARLAGERTTWIVRNRYYYEMIVAALRFIIEPGKRVLNVQCENGLLLDRVDPSYGVGTEITGEMVAEAERQTGRHIFRVADPEALGIDETFDYVLLNNVNHITDVLLAFRGIANTCEAHTRLVIYTHNHLWRPLLRVGEWVGLRMPSLEQNWLSEADLKGLLTLAGFDWVRTYRTIMCPVRIPILSKVFNDFLCRMPGFQRLSMISILVARPRPTARRPEDVSVSIIVPCKDEEENVAAAVERIPDMGKSTEILFCDDKSTDGTRKEVERMKREHPRRNIRLIDGPGINKAMNVWAGFDAAEGDVLMILDADLTVMPEELPYFFDAIVSGTGEFINGVRLVYPIQKRAMRTFNLLGNKAFSAVFSLLLGQRVKDTLCGTKVLWRSDWSRIKPQIGSWGTTDRWGDFELLFGASKLNLRIVDLPVHYQERIFGATKMVRVFNNGINMLRMSIHAFFRLRFGF